MKFRLEMTCDNAAFDGNERDLEVARILRVAAHEIESSGEATLRDYNGNTVGRAEFIDAE